MNNTRTFPLPLDAESVKQFDTNGLIRYYECDPLGLSTEEAQARLSFYGSNTIQEQRKSHLIKFLSYFWGPIAWMIEAAAILSAVVRNVEDMVIILVLLFFNAIVGFWQEYQAGNAIEQLKKNLALKARVYRDREWGTIDASELVPGDQVRVVLGDVIPADIALMQGDYLSVDQSALTGESLPVDKHAGDLIYSSTVVKQGEMTGIVTSTGAHTFFGKTARLVGTASTVSHFKKAVIKIGDYLIFISMILVMILVLVGMERHLPTMELVQFALILTVAAIPVALPAVLSVTLAVGAIKLAQLKAIVSRLESIEELAGMDILCSDKTGTLTQNSLTMGAPVTFNGVDKPMLIDMAILSSHLESPDAIDKAIIGDTTGHTSELYQVRHFIPFDPINKRTEAEIHSKTGEVFRVTKGAPQVVFALCAQDVAIKQSVENTVNQFAMRGYRTLGVARTDKTGQWMFLGILPLFDPPRTDAAQTIQEAKAHGVDIKMVTGDNIAIAKQIAGELGLGNNILLADQIMQSKTESGHVMDEQVCAEEADGFAQVFPEHKYWLVSRLQDRNHLVGMTGDGVNDAPALKQADVGIAVSGATDAARVAADLVLTDTGLGVIIRAIEEARRIFERMNAYAIYRITETIRIMLFMVSAILLYNFYPITAVMIILLALLNDLPILAIAKDNACLSPVPVRWNMRRVLTVATVLGVVGVLETFLLLILAKNKLHVSLGELQTIIFLKLIVAGHLTLFVARTRQSFLSRPYPSPLLFFSIFSTQLLAVFIAKFGWFVTPISWSYIGLIWTYCLIWVFVEDGLKLQVYRHLDHSDVR